MNSRLHTEGEIPHIRGGLTRDPPSFPGQDDIGHTTRVTDRERSKVYQ